MHLFFFLVLPLMSPVMMKVFGGKLALNTSTFFLWRKNKFGDYKVEKKGGKERQLCRGDWESNFRKSLQ